jgi:diguanylate cyclase (GGDEF)-like protein
MLHARSGRVDVAASAERAPLGLALTHRLLEHDAVEDVRRAIVEGTKIITRGAFVRLWEESDGELAATAADGDDPPHPGDRVERRLLRVGGPASTLEEGHDATLDDLCGRYRSAGRLCHVRPLRGFQGDSGVIAFHCLDRTRLAPGELELLRRYAGSAGLALANAFAREALRRLAYSDTLTGLANRRAIDEHLTAAGDDDVAVLFVDFDGLKRINDTIGYEAGDAVIRAVGEALRAVARPGWLPGRLGGDEFVVVLTAAAAAHPRQEAAFLSALLRDLAVPAEAAPHYRGASVGWARAEHDEEPASVVRRAAAAMKATKDERR